MDKIEELVEYVGHWVLDGGLTCICCEPDNGGSHECEETEQHGANICDALRRDIRKLLSHPDLALIVDRGEAIFGDHKGKHQTRAIVIPLAEALEKK